MKIGQIQLSAWHVAFTLLTLCSSALAEDIVHLRGGAQALVGDIQTIDDAGITIRRLDAPSTTAPRVISWDRVGRVETDSIERRLEQYRPIAEEIWRSRSRLERGDTLLAEPGFERQFERYHGSTNETALVVAEGLLRCRLARLANADVIIPMLEVVRLRRSGVETTSYSYLPVVFDAQVSMCPYVSPMLVNDGTLRRLERDLLSYDSKDDAYVDALRNLQLHAIRVQLGQDDVFAFSDLPREPGLQLQSAILQAVSSDPAAREQARRGLERLEPSLPEWAGAWVSIAVGRSLLLESSLPQKLDGMVLLAELPAASRHRMQHHLIGIALAELAAALESLGDSHGAEAMRVLLEARYPTHPVHEQVQQEK